MITAGEVPDEAAAAEFIVSGAPDRVETWNVDGARHTGGLTTDPLEWEFRFVGRLPAQFALAR